MALLEKYISHEGTLDAVEQDMTLDTDSLAHIISILTEMYSDPEMTVIREYSTNARDSHIEAGKADVPIEVTLPTTLNPQATITDHGVGMTSRQVATEFSRYGFSTKRGTNEQTGRLGLGCKSGLAYTSQFTLTTTRDGITAVVLLTRKADGAGAFRIVNESFTGLPNGVTVKLPVRNIDSFRRKAREFFSYWDAGQALIDGAPNESLWDQECLLDLEPGSVRIFSQRDLNYDTVVMGGVPYPITMYEHTTALDEAILGAQRSKSRTSRVLVRVPMGAVNFAPSREALANEYATKETMKDLTTWLSTAIMRHTGKMLASCKTHVEARDKAWEIHQEGWQYGAYRGDVPPRPTELMLYEPGSAARVIQIAKRRPSWSGDPDRGHKTSGLQASTLATRSLVVTGFTGNGTSAKAKAQARHHLETLGTSALGNILFVPGQMPPLWFDDVPTVSWEVLRATKVPGWETSGKSRKKYDRYRWASITTEGVVLPDRQGADLPLDTIAWMNAKDYGDGKHLLAPFAGATVAIVMSVSQGRFERDNPTIPPLRQALTGLVIPQRYRQITPELAVRMWYRHSERYSQDRLPFGPDKLVGFSSCIDPEIRRLAHKMKTGINPEALAFWERHAGSYSREIKAAGYPATPPWGKIASRLVTQINAALAKYTLLPDLVYFDGMGMRDRQAYNERVIDYMNDTYLRERAIRPIIL